MMNKSIKLVVTTISAPNEVLLNLEQGCQLNNWDFLVIGDVKSPSDFSLPSSQYYDLAAQVKLEFEYVKLCPTQHYARKNIGYLIAISDNAKSIVETDDDNFPIESFWQESQLEIQTRLIDNVGWVNVYKYFSDCRIWPRGLPLDAIDNPMPFYGDLMESFLICPIQQGLADNNPDVDAIYRLILPLPQVFKHKVKIALGKESWCPFNSQNTIWFPPAYPLMYLPAYCSFRMTDIWRSLIAQRICWENNWCVLFYSPTVYQERNIHNLMKDFEDEVPGYLNNNKIAHILSNIKLQSGEVNIPDNLRKCYEVLISSEIFPLEEINLLEAWLSDISSLKN